mmetsp:Transcript_12739/g.31274  ORF Transcript_12739/g.31274 Transcript_12739/m.31274 type:complete len:444 (+) Transcript_12739:261-1592(+)|eukprot:CAMPEP_0114517334 /NCGR_PEP_ID=MMETSP0109-20121206/17833_1 /TAXON_ID=29199 /ORGANISM="Chlorarachnion reptans, Strain CCCM449" /LENGTH=443 /DNA_ID=CAMNT_0001697837 /DNA_START=237 /DNA_END=1568 /DNA_ORIENTATION=+
MSTSNLGENEEPQGLLQTSDVKGEVMKANISEAEEGEILLGKPLDKKRTGRGSSWLGDNDEKDREEFLLNLSRQKLPMPQNEGDWHAARVYVDSLQRSLYDIEQWRDYLSLKNKLPIASPRGRSFTFSGKPSKKKLSPARSRSKPRPKSRKPPPPPGPPPGSPEFKLQMSVSQLVDMGFTDIPTVEAVVIACNGDFHQALNMLLTSATNQKRGRYNQFQPHAHTAESKGSTNQRRNRTQSWAPTGHAPKQIPSIFVSCGACRSKLRVQAGVQTFICGVCQSKNILTSQRPCPSCGCGLRYHPSSKHIMCPRCSTVIETRTWNLVRVTQPEPILPGSIARDESSSSLASSRENGTTKSTPWDRATFSTPLQTPHRAEKDVEPETIIDNVAIEESGEGQHEKVIDIDVTRVTISQPKEMSESKGREKNSKDQEPVIDTLHGTASV